MCGLCVGYVWVKPGSDPKQIRHGYEPGMAGCAGINEGENWLPGGIESSQNRDRYRDLCFILKIGTPATQKSELNGIANEGESLI